MRKTFNNIRRRNYFKATRCRYCGYYWGNNFPPSGNCPACGENN